MNNGVEAENISFVYDDRFALKNVSFQFESGTFTAIAGPNGSGKTTLVKIAAGLIKPLSGVIKFCGRNREEFRKHEIARKVAWVPQSPEPVFGYRVKNLVMMGRSPHQGFLGFESKADRAIAKAALEQTDSIHLAERFLPDLSGGELQRVFIARAICQTDEFLLLDEPTSSLDPAHQIQIMNTLKKMCINKKTTVIMISHDLNLCSMFADRLVLMKEGRVAGQGRPDSVLEPSLLEHVYRCRFSVRFISGSGFPVVLPAP